ncbi:MAG: hypothetical protein JWP89_6996 [Schlesneria sp.]|nr:hypothetical protein [Schlesneria sp.]
MMPLPIRVDVDNLPPLIMGALLLCAAAFMALKQWWAHRRLMQNMKVNEAGYQIAERQIRHRLAVGVLLFVLAVAIPLGDQLDIFFRARPGVFFAYWMGVLLLVFAMVVIALGDILSTLAAARLSQVDLRRERQELEEEIRRFRAQSNGTDEKHDER